MNIPQQPFNSLEELVEDYLARLGFAVVSQETMDLIERVEASPSTATRADFDAIFDQIDDPVFRQLGFGVVLELLNTIRKPTRISHLDDNFDVAGARMAGVISFFGTIRDDKIGNRLAIGR